MLPPSPPLELVEELELVLLVELVEPDAPEEDVLDASPDELLEVEDATSPELLPVPVVVLSHAVIAKRMAGKETKPTEAICRASMSSMVSCISERGNTAVCANVGVLDVPFVR